MKPLFYAALCLSLICNFGAALWKYGLLHSTPNLSAELVVPGTRPIEHLDLPFAERVTKTFHSRGYPYSLAYDTARLIIERENAKQLTVWKELAASPWLVGSKEASVKLKALKDSLTVETTHLLEKAGYINEYDPSKRERLGRLNGDKKSAVIALERDFRINTKPTLEFNNPENAVLPANESDAELKAAAAFRAKLTELLDPEEVVDYYHFSSPVARKVQQTTSAVEISQQTYLRMVNEADFCYAKLKPGAVGHRETRLEAQCMLLAKYREILGDAMFVAITTTVDYEATSFYAVLDAPPAVKAGLFTEAHTFLAYQKVREGSTPGQEAAKRFLGLVSKFCSRAEAEKFKNLALWKSMTAAISAEPNPLR